LPRKLGAKIAEKNISVISSGWRTRGNKPKDYSVSTVLTWYGVLRNMTRDAIDELDLQRDPTLRITFPEPESEPAPKALTSQHYALTVFLAYTGLRFCHASSLRWDDWDEQAGVLCIVRKQVRGRVGPISRKKRAPREFPIEPELAAVLREHRRDLLRRQAPGLADGWMFPALMLGTLGTLRRQGPLAKAYAKCLDTVGITRRFTIHGMGYTFTDLTRLADVAPVVRRSLVGHVTERMQHHYSSVALAEKRAAVADVYGLAPLTGFSAKSGERGGDSGPTE
jgi:integrase